MIKVLKIMFKHMEEKATAQRVEKVMADQIKEAKMLTFDLKSSTETKGMCLAISE